MFWAVLFISVGVILLVQTVFKIDLPVMRILFGVFLIYMGLKVIFGSFGQRMSYFKVHTVSSDTESIFTQNNMKAKGSDGQINKKFSTVFGSSKLDLRGLSAEELSHEIKIDSAFGRTQVLTDSNTPIKAEIDTGFAGVTIRGQKISSFGETFFQTSDYSVDKPALKLNIDAAFGEVIVE